MIRVVLILGALASLGAGCASSDDAGFVVNGSNVIIPGQAGGEIRVDSMPASPSISVDGAF